MSEPSVEEGSAATAAPQQEHGPVALVTGAASGIGRATARRLAEAGMTVAAADLNAERIESGQQRIRPFAVDVAEERSVAALADGVERECGVPQVLVNCAGWDQTHRFTDTDRAFWERVVAINLLGVIAVTHAFLAAMIERGRGGRIVNVGSDAGRVGSSGEAVYAGAKGGVIAFTKSLARESARHGITANVVCPGPTDTPLFRAQPERLQQALEKAVPMGRLGTPEDVAAAIAFFSSREAGYVTGQVLSVSGGLTMAG
jgi:2-hydroxycyclohexanecarboxyl-CoA dehydrogenase